MGMTRKLLSRPCRLELPLTRVDLEVPVLPATSDESFSQLLLQADRRDSPTLRTGLARCHRTQQLRSLGLKATVALLCLSAVLHWRPWGLGFLPGLFAVSLAVSKASAKFWWLLALAALVDAGSTALSQRYALALLQATCAGLSWATCRAIRSERRGCEELKGLAASILMKRGGGGSLGTCSTRTPTSSSSRSAPQAAWSESHAVTESERKHRWHCA
eukprot:TRINITY_DN103582_c0_g1_i1.p1 TRINITY_DN103582_c0_g1~~TRINITY_DN103582_c0_g1_i1.p1  ORF type:complete len:217 (+),score=37.31 TRINITY_DN103582_c0_g1_i1:54-704(+)